MEEKRKKMGRGEFEVLLWTSILSGESNPKKKKKKKVSKYSGATDD